MGEVRSKCKRACRTDPTHTHTPHPPPTQPYYVPFFPRAAMPGLDFQPEVVLASSGPLFKLAASSVATLQGLALSGLPLGTPHTYSVGAALDPLRGVKRSPFLPFPCFGAGSANNEPLAVFECGVATVVGR